MSLIIKWKLKGLCRYPLSRDAARHPHPRHLRLRPGPGLLQDHQGAHHV